MRRRAFVALAGALLSAGCGAGPLSGGEGTRDGGGGQTVQTPGTYNAPTPVGYGENAEGEGNQAGDGDPDGEETEELPEEERTAEGNPQAAADIDAARSSLRAAYDAYVGQAPGRNPGLLDVTATLDGFAARTVQNHVGSATQSLDAALEYATEPQRIAVQRLRGFGEALTAGARLQERLVAAHTRFRWGLERFYGESGPNVRRAVRDVRQGMATAREEWETLESGLDRTDVQAVSYVTEDAYDSKFGDFGQLDRAIETLDEFAVALRRAEEGLDALRAGVSAYQNEEWQTADSALGSAAIDFLVAGSTFEYYYGPTSLEPLADRLYADFGALQVGAEHLELSAEAGEDGEIGDREDQQERAAEAIEANERVEEMRTSGRIARMA